MGIFDRYLLRKFLVPFFYCLVGFISIWFIFDLSNNLLNYIEGGASWEQLATYYRSQIPEIVVICLPLSTLLALLYSLTAMSRSNEIISMLGVGVHTMRLLMPIFLVGLVLTGVVTYFNYEAVPRAAVIKRDMLRSIKNKVSGEVGLINHLYRNREDLRTWFMRRLIPGSQSAEDLQIIQQNENDDIVAQYYASKAKYEPLTQTWILTKGMYVERERGDKPSVKEIFEERQITGWTETPWRIASTATPPDYLTVPELQIFLANNADYAQRHLAAYRTQLAYRWALPWVCVLVVLLAAPMGIIYSRRGGLGAAGVALALFFSMIFLSIIAVAFGKGDYIPPWLAAWGPLIAYFVLGSYLLWIRATNRELKIPGF